MVRFLIVNASKEFEVRKRLCRLILDPKLCLMFDDSFVFSATGTTGTRFSNAGIAVDMGVVPVRIKAGSSLCVVRWFPVVDERFHQFALEDRIGKRCQQSVKESNLIFSLVIHRCTDRCVCLGGIL